MNVNQSANKVVLFILMMKIELWFKNLKYQILNLFKVVEDLWCLIKKTK
jgi:hypothetical protein